MREEVLRLDKVITVEDDIMLLNHFNLHIYSGEIMGLIAINLHGIDSLVEVICRNVPLYYGYVYFQEQLVNTYARSSSTQNRVAIIDENSRLMGHLTVADNIYVIRPNFKKYIINSKVLNAQFELITKDLGVYLSGEQIVQDLNYFEKCVVELLRAFISGAKLIIIRDINNLFSISDLARFHKLMEQYASMGISFLYICSHHQKALPVSDKIGLMKNGKIIKVLEKSEFTEEAFFSYAYDFNKSNLIGRKPTGNSLNDNRTVLMFNNVSSESIHRLTFQVHAGECVVLLDMNNSLHQDLLELLNTERTPQEGEILIHGQHLDKKRAKAVGIVPDKPIQNSLFHELSYFDNLCITSDHKQRFFWTRKSIRKSIIKEYEPCIGLDIHASDIAEMSMESLYSLVYHRILLQKPAVTFCVNPFSEGDLYLRLHILSLIQKLKDNHIAVIILSLNVLDNLLVADRVFVLEDGRVKKEIASGEFSKLAELL